MNEFEQLVQRVESALMGLIRLAEQANEKIDGVLDTKSTQGKLSKELVDAASALETFEKVLKNAASNRKNSGFGRLQEGVKNLNQLIKELDVRNITKLQKAFEGTEAVMSRISALSASQRNVINTSISAATDLGNAVKDIAQLLRSTNQDVKNLAGELSDAINALDFTDAVNKANQLKSTLGSVTLGNSTQFNQQLDTVGGKLDYITRRAEVLNEALRTLDVSRLEQAADKMTAATQSKPSARAKSASTSQNNVASVSSVDVPEVSFGNVDLSKVIARVKEQLGRDVPKLEKVLSDSADDVTQAILSGFLNKLATNIQQRYVTAVNSGVNKDQAAATLKAEVDVVDPNELIASAVLAVINKDTSSARQLVQFSGRQATSSLMNALKEAIVAELGKEAKEGLGSFIPDFVRKGASSTEFRSSRDEQEIRAFLKAPKGNRSQRSSTPKISFEDASIQVETTLDNLIQLNEVIEESKVKLIRELASIRSDFAKRLEDYYSKDPQKKWKDEDFNEILIKRTRQNLSNTAVEETNLQQAVKYGVPLDTARSADYYTIQAFSDEVERILSRVSQYAETFDSMQSDLLANIESGKVNPEEATAEFVKVIEARTKELKESLSKMGLSDELINDLIANRSGVQAFIEEDLKLSEAINQKRFAWERQKREGGNISALRSSAPGELVDAVQQRLQNTSSESPAVRERSGLIGGLIGGLKDLGRLTLGGLKEGLDSLDQALASVKEVVSPGLIQDLLKMRTVVDGVIRTSAEFGETSKEFTSELKQATAALKSLALASIEQKIGDGESGAALNYALNAAAGKRIAKTVYDEDTLRSVIDQSLNTDVRQEGSIYRTTGDKVLGADLADAAANMKAAMEAARQSSTGIAIVGSAGTNIGASILNTREGKDAFDHVFALVYDRVNDTFEVIEQNVDFAKGNQNRLGVATLGSDNTPKSLSELASQADRFTAVPLNIAQDQAEAFVKAMRERSQADGATYSFVNDEKVAERMGVVVGDTCSSAIAKSLKDAGVSVPYLKQGEAFNTITPSQVVDTVRQLTEGRIPVENVPTSPLQRDLSGDSLQRSSRIGNFDFAVLLRPLTEAGKELDNFALGMKSLFAQIYRLNTVQDVVTAIRLFKTTMDDSYPPIRRVISALELLEASLRAVDDQSLKRAQEVLKKAVEYVTEGDREGTGAFSDVRNFIADSVGAAFSNNKLLNDTAYKAYNQVMDAQSTEDLENAIWSLRKALESLDNIDIDIKNVMVGIARDLALSVREGTDRSTMELSAAFRDAIFGASVTSYDNASGFSGAPEEASSVEFNTTQKAVSETFSALKSGVPVLDSISSGYATVNFFSSQFGAVINSLKEFAFASKEINTGTLVDMLGAILKFIGAIQNIASKTIGWGRTDRNAPLFMGGDRKDRRDTIMTVARQAAIRYDQVNEGIAPIEGAVGENELQARKSAAKIAADQFVKRRFRGKLNPSREAGMEYIVNSLVSQGYINDQSMQFQQMWQKMTPDVKAKLPEIVADIEKRYGKMITAQGYKSNVPESRSSANLKTSQRAMEEAADAAMNSNINMLLSGRGAAERSDAYRKIIQNLTDEELTRVKTMEAGLLKLANGTGLTNLVEKEGYLVVNEDSLLRIFESVFGKDSAHANELRQVQAEGGIAGLSVRLPGRDDTRVAASVIGQQRDDITAGEAALHELTHNLTNRIQEQSGTLFDQVDSTLRKDLLANNQDVREAIQRQTAQFGESMQIYVKSVFSNLDYYLLPEEILATVGQALLSGNDKLIGTLRSVYGGELFDSAVSTLERAAPDIYGESARSTIASRFSDFDTTATAATSASSSEVRQMFDFEGFKSSVKAIFEGIQSEVNQVQSLVDGFNLSGSVELGGVLSAGIQQFASTGSLKSQIAGDLLRSTDLRQALSNFLEDVSIDSLKNLARSFGTVGGSSALQRLGIASTNNGGFDPSSIISQDTKFDLVLSELGTRLSAGDLSSKYFEDFNKSFKASTGEDLRKSGFNVQSVYDFEAGVTRLTASAKTATGAMTSLNAVIDDAGEFKIEKAERGISSYLNRVREEIIQEIPEEIIEEFIQAIIFYFQELFSEILAIQDEVAKLEILIEQTEALGAEASFAKTRSLVKEAIDIAAETGQGFEEAIGTLIQNFKILGSVRDLDVRSDLSTRLTATQLGSQSVFGLTLDQSLETLPAIFAQIRDSLATDPRYEDSTPEQIATEATSRLEYLMNEFVVAQRASGASSEDLVGIYANLGATAKDLGIANEDLLALSSVASTKLTGGSQEVSTALKFFLERLFSASGSDKLAEYGIATKRVNEDGKLVNREVFDIINDINDVIAQTPALASAIAFDLGSNARKGQVSTILSAAGDAQRVGDVVSTQTKGDEFSSELERTSQKFEGSLNAVKANLGSFLDTVLFSSGLLNDLGNSLRTMSGYFADLAKYLEENRDLMSSLTPFISAVGQALIFITVSGGKGFFKLAGLLNKVGLEVRNLVTRMENLATTTEPLGQRLAKAGEAAIDEFRELQSQGKITEEVFDSMAVSMQSALDKVGLAIKENKDLLAAFTNQLTALGGIAEASSSASIAGEVADAASDLTTDADTTKANESMSMLAANTEKAAAAETKKEIATTKATAAENEATAAKRRNNMSLDQTNNALARFKAFLSGYTGKGAATGVAPYMTTNAGRMLNKSLGVAGELAVPVVFDLMLGGTEGENLTNVGAGIAGGVIGALVTGGNPLGMMIGYQMGQAFQESVDVYGTYFGTSDKEKDRSTDFLARASAEDLNALQKFYESGRAEQIAQEYGDARLGDLNDTNFITRFLNTGSSLITGGMGNVLEGQGTMARSYRMQSELQDFDPRVRELAIESGVTSYEEFVALLREMNTEGSELQENVARTRQFIEMTEQAQNELNGSISDGGAYYGSVGQTIDDIESKTRALSDELDRMFSTPQKDSFLMFSEFGTERQALQESYAPKFAAIESGSIQGEQADSIMEEYRLAQEAMAGIPQLEAMLLPLQDILGQTFGDLKQTLYDLGPEGQSAIQSMVEPMIEMIGFVKEYELNLENIAALQAEIALLEPGAEGYSNAVEELAVLEEQKNARAEMYEVYAQYLAMVAKSPNLLQNEMNAINRQNKAKTRYVPGRAAEFRMPSMVDVGEASTEDIIAALEDARRKQADIVKMFPQMANEFAKEQFMLDANGQYSGVTGVSQSYFQEALNERSRKEKLTAPDTVDLSEYDDATIQKILTDARSMQDQAVALAPDLADEYADDRLLIMQKNNELMLETGLSQEYLRAAIEANTKSTDGNTEGLRGHYNLPSGYRPPTIWDYYNEGGTEAGSVNYVPPESQSGGLVSMEMAQNIANAILAQGTSSSSSGPDLSSLGSLIDPNARPLGYPEPGTPGKVIMPPELDLPNGIETSDITIANTSLSDILRGSYNDGSETKPDTRIPTSDALRERMPTGEEPSVTGTPIKRDLDYFFETRNLLGGAPVVPVSKPQNDIESLPPGLRDSSELSGISADLLREAYGLEEATQKSKTAVSRYASESDGASSVMNNMRSALSDMQREINSLNGATGPAATGVGLLGNATSQFGKGASAFGQAIGSLVTQIVNLNLTNLIAASINSGQLKITINGNPVQATANTGSSGPRAAASGRGSPSYTGTPATGSNNRI